MPRRARQVGLGRRPDSPLPVVESGAHAMRVANRLTKDDLASLMRIFESEDHAHEDGLDMETFTRSFQQLLGRRAASREQLALLFMKMDTTCDDLVDWDEFCTFMLIEHEQQEEESAANLVAQALPFPERAVVAPVIHRDSVQGIVFQPTSWRDLADDHMAGTHSGAASAAGGSGQRGLPARRLRPTRPASSAGPTPTAPTPPGPPSVGIGRFLSIAGDGVLHKWTPDLCLHQRFQLPTTGRDDKKRVTCCALLPRNRLAVAFTSRTLNIFDLNTPQAECVAEIYGLGGMAVSMSVHVASAFPPANSDAGSTITAATTTTSSSSGSPTASTTHHRSASSSNAFLPMGFGDPSPADPLTSTPNVATAQRASLLLGMDNGHVIALVFSQLQQTLFGEQMSGVTCPLIATSAPPLVGPALVSAAPAQAPGPAAAPAAAAAAAAPPLSSTSPHPSMMRFALTHLQHAACHRRFVLVEQTQPLHAGVWCSQVGGYHGLGSYIAASADPTRALVVYDGKTMLSAFEVVRGVKTFDFAPAQNMIVTGGLDGTLRLWSPYVSKSSGALKGHTCAVFKVQLVRLAVSGRRPPLQGRARGKARPVRAPATRAGESAPLWSSDDAADDGVGTILSLSEDRVLKIWCMQDLSCLYTLAYRFPLPQAPPLTAAFFHKRTNTLLLGNTKVAALTATPQRASHGDRSHAAPVRAAIYNPLFNQVVSGCRAANIKVWNLDTGEKMVQFDGAHSAPLELTALAFDRSQRRLFTGASDGSVKIWNFNVGLCLRKLVGDRKAEVTSIVQLKSQAIITAGWAKRISCFSRLGDYYYVNPDRSNFASHRDDILSLCPCPPDLIASGDYDGNISLWQADGFVPIHTLKTSELHQAMRLPRSARSVEKLVFFQRAARGGDRARPTAAMLGAELSTATLIACGGGGWVYFWDMYTSRCLAWFQAVEDGETTPSLASVVGIKLTPECDKLVVGDNRGCISVWDVSGITGHGAGRDGRTAAGGVEGWGTGGGLGGLRCKYPPPRKPPLVHKWQAHSQNLASVELIRRHFHVLAEPGPDGLPTANCFALGCPGTSATRPVCASATVEDLVLTASSDHDVCLWLLDGMLVGTFGQEQPWQIGIPETYQGRCRSRPSNGEGQSSDTDEPVDETGDARRVSGQVQVHHGGAVGVQRERASVQDAAGAAEAIDATAMLGAANNQRPRARCFEVRPCDRRRRRLASFMTSTMAQTRQRQLERMAGPGLDGRSARRSTAPGRPAPAAAKPLGFAALPIKSIHNLLDEPLAAAGGADQDCQPPTRPQAAVPGGRDSEDMDIAALLVSTRLS